MTKNTGPLGRVLISLRHGYRGWRFEQLMPSVLFELNRSMAEDLGVVPQDLNDAIERRWRR